MSETHACPLPIPSECAVLRVGLLAVLPAAPSLKISAAVVARKFLNFEHLFGRAGTNTHGTHRQNDRRIHRAHVPEVTARASPVQATISSLKAVCAEKK